jgi:DNA (cytosine-5)-methyltransferase 1
MEGRGLIVDGFAGGGGASTGMEAALGRDVDIAINHSALALQVHAANHPRTRHLISDIWEVNPKEATGGRPVWVAWFSPDCRDFSVAKGGRPRSKEIRSLAWVVRRWAKDVRPEIIFVENVPEFEGWGPLGEDGFRIPERVGETFRRWRRDLERLGYRVEHRVLAACEYGAPTSRERLFVVARRDGLPVRWPEPTHGPGRPLPYHSAAECIDWSDLGRSIFGRRTKTGKPNHLAPKTMWRIAEGLRRFVLESDNPFIVPAPPRLVASWLVEVNHGRPLDTITGRDHHSLTAATLIKLRGQCTGADPRQPMPTVSAQGTHLAAVAAFLTTYYGSDGTAGQDVREPIRTITGKQRHGLVTVQGTPYQICDITLRMLRPPELLRGQFGRFAEKYDLSAARTLEAQTELIGNSVPPEVAEALVRANVPELAEVAAA